MILQFIEDSYTHTTQTVLTELISELDQIEDVTSLVVELNGIVADMIDVSICKYDLQTNIYGFVEAALLKHGIVIDTNTITYSYIRDILVTLRSLRVWNEIHSPTAIDVLSDEELEDINIFGHLVNIYTTTDPNCVSEYLIDILPGMISDMNTAVQNLEVLDTDDIVISHEFNDCVRSIPENLMTANLYQWLLTKLTLDVTCEDLISVFITVAVDKSLSVSETIDELKVLLIVVNYNKDMSTTTNVLINIEATLEELSYSNSNINLIIGVLNEQE